VFLASRVPEFLPTFDLCVVASTLDIGQIRAMNEAAHILVVDDQKEICDVVQEYLSGEGYQVTAASDGTSMRRVMAQHSIDLVILDLILPGEDGLTLARVLRQESNVGIIILTGRGETVDRIIGLEMGADDYLPKPFHLRELLARVKSVLRRGSARGKESAPGGNRSKARFSGWNLDLSTRALVSPAGSEVRLTTGEFDLLAAFVNNANQVLSRDRLLDLARNREAGPFDRTIDVQVGRLRRKLEDDPQKPTMIKTVRGTGYIFTPTVEVN
jgi:two-component system OmpR family response regulator